MSIRRRNSYAQIPTSGSICYTTDDLCRSCPAKLSDGVCKDDDKVQRYDARVIDILDLKDGE